MLWPVGQVNWSTDTGWDNLTTLLKAGVAGARSGNRPGTGCAIMLHFDEGGNNANSVPVLRPHGGRRSSVRRDRALVLHVLPRSADRAARTTSNDLATRYGRKIVIAESQYAVDARRGGDSTGNFVWQASQVEPGIPGDAGRDSCRSTTTCSRFSFRVPNHLRDRPLLLGARVDPGRGLGARRRYAERQPDAVLVHRAAALPSVGLFREPARGMRRIRALDAALRGTERRELRRLWNVIGRIRGGTSRLAAPGPVTHRAPVLPTARGRWRAPARPHDDERLPSPIRRCAGRPMSRAATSPAPADPRSSRAVAR